MRLRLRCAAAYDLGDLQWCMVHVPDHVQSVGELACHVSTTLDLPGHGPDGEAPPQLLLGGFLVPHCEEVRQVLRDDEVVDVEPADPSLASLGWAALPALAAGKKRPALTNGAAHPAVNSGKRPRTDVTAILALGWPAPDAAAASGAGGKKQPAPKAKAKVVPPEESSSSEEESSEEEEPPARGGKGKAAGRGKSQSASKGEDWEAASKAARAASAATCGKGPEDAGSGVFVGGLPYSVDDAALRKHFEAYGAVEDAAVVMNNNTGRSKGFGFVEFASVAARDKAMAVAHTIDGKDVEVKPRVPKASKGEDGKGGKGGKDAKGGKDGKGVKGKGKDGKEGKGKEGKGKGKEAVSDAPKAKKEAPKPSPAGSDSGEEDEEEAELQRQMAALGLPVSFTANDDKGQEEDEDEEEEEEEDE